MNLMVESRATATREGIIPHLEVFTDLGIVRAPVKVEVINDRSRKMKVLKPVRTDGGALIYVLPGNVEYVA